MRITEITETAARRKVYAAETKAHKDGTVEAYVSTETIDRVGDIVRTSAWHLDNYIKSGSPVLFSHDYSLPPIGNAVEMRIENRGLWARTQFHEKTQLSRDLASLAREGIMKSWSVGFSALEPPENRVENGALKGYIFNSVELLEYSLVSVPANPEAVSRAADAGRIAKSTAAMLTRSAWRPDEDSRDAEAVAHFLRAVDRHIRGAGMRRTSRYP